MRRRKTPERKAIEKQDFVRLARNGEEVGSYKLHEIELRAVQGEFLPSDYILIEGKRPRWIFLFKVTDVFFYGLPPQKHKRLAKKEEEKVLCWIKEKRKEIRKCGNKKALGEKQAELKGYQELLAFLQAIPGLLRKVVIDDKVFNREGSTC